MVMVRINNMRLNNIISNFSECLMDADYSLMRLEKSEDKMERRAFSNSLKQGVISIFTNCEDYLGMCLKKVGIGVTDKSFRDCLEYAISFNLIDKDFANCLSNNMKIRNFMSHRYDQPSLEEIIKFYKVNRDAFNSQIEFMENLSKSELTKNEILKKSSIFN